ncbi:HAD family hydrolase [Xenorhabdus stockiae]|uniref:HAD family hydrolase n=1 Tax=Xenorhabdus stockiae TaxID=351614 RepID=UPI004063FB52
MIIALDFDGVVVDSINECLLISWNIINGHGYQQFNERTLKLIPSDFKKLFRNYRNYMRHDGHFIVPYYFNDKFYIDKNSLESIYSNISKSDKDKFRDLFIEYRNSVRNLYPDVWISLHRPLINMKSLLNIGDECIIVSGKDSESINLLLESMGIKFPMSKIYGRMTSKSELLGDIKNESYMMGNKFIFIDDNLDNVKEAIEHDIPSVWAEWGYNVKEQFREARKFKVPSVSKEDLSDFIKSLH